MSTLQEVSTNKEVYNFKEFSRWAYGNGLLPEENYLIETYLDKNKKTLEAGTGGGRILLAMKQMGFTSLYGFDYLPEFIEVAKGRDAEHTISFEVQDATRLKYEDCSFDQILYLCQMISSIDDELGRSKAIEQAYRILKAGGIGLFSFLCFEARNSSALYKPYLAYLRLLRKWSGSTRSIQYLPWLRYENKPNFLALFDRGAYVYWYKVQEAYQLLKKANFEVIFVGSSYQISKRIVHNSPESLADEPLTRMLYFVCKK